MTTLRAPASPVDRDPACETRVLTLSPEEVALGVYDAVALLYSRTAIVVLRTVSQLESAGVSVAGPHLARQDEVGIGFARKRALERLDRLRAQRPDGAPGPVRSRRFG